LDTLPAHCWLPLRASSPRQVAAFCSPNVSIDCAEQSRPDFPMAAALSRWRLCSPMAANGTTLKIANMPAGLSSMRAIPTPYRGGERHLSIAFTPAFLSIPSSNSHARSPRHQKPPHPGCRRGLDVAFGAMPRQGGQRRLTAGPIPQANSIMVAFNDGTRRDGDICRHWALAKETLREG
jgi:hypothetical protein